LATCKVLPLVNTCGGSPSWSTGQARHPLHRTSDSSSWFWRECSDRSPLSRHHNVSPAPILQANDYKGPRALSPGQKLIIPRPTTAAGAPASEMAFRNDPYLDSALELKTYDIG